MSDDEQASGDVGPGNIDGGAHNLTKKTGFRLKPTCTIRLRDSYLIKLEDPEADVGDDKPVGALLLAMQAVQRALEQCQKTGQKIQDKDKSLPDFSKQNYGDQHERDKNKKAGSALIRIRRATIFSETLKKMGQEKWAKIFEEARKYLPEKKRERAASSAATLVDNGDSIEDPDADFVMEL
ncbi:hypothetical protein F5887DRAFT_1079236 [Amanita rubescens]|nr:hypothetical protein F5887DRAFT_1079236 [Amanita rubescens]